MRVKVTDPMAPDIVEESRFSKRVQSLLEALRARVRAVEAKLAERSEGPSRIRHGDSVLETTTLPEHHIIVFHLDRGRSQCHVRVSLVWKDDKAVAIEINADSPIIVTPLVSNSVRIAERTDI